MTTALLSLLLGCFDAPAPPVAVVVEYAAADRFEYNYGTASCGMSEVDFFWAQWDDLDPNTEEREEQVHQKKMMQKGALCCTHNGGEHVGWKKLLCEYVEPPLSSRFIRRHFSSPFNST